MTVALRKAVPVNAGYARSFYTDTPQDPAARTATIDLRRGASRSARPSNNETMGATANNLNSPITFGVDAAFLPRVSPVLVDTRQRPAHRPRAGA